MTSFLRKTVNFTRTDQNNFTTKIESVWQQFIFGIKEMDREMKQTNKTKKNASLTQH